MQPKRLHWWLVLVAVFALALAGCAPRPGQGETAAQPGAEQLAVDLPALIIDVDSNGSFSVGGVPLAALASGFGVAGLETLSLPPEQVTMMTDANIQHVQINNLPDGLKLLVNGQEIPTLVWDGESLAALQGLAGELGEGVPPVLQQILPVLGQLGVGVIVRFPLAQGAELIPLEVTGEASAAAAAAEAQQAFLSSVGAPPRINIPVQYAADGSWTVAGMTDTEWIAVTGQSFWESLRLPEELVSDLTAAGVEEIVVSTDPEGIHVAINGQQLPYITWGEGRLSHALSLAAQAGLLGDLDGEDAGSLTEAIEALLPMVTSSEVQIHVFLPS
ncbi:MAG: hypothetical protein DCC55_07370 [Chloroflexi bacterium]|nr:MAG: hypothetical protein DCC55_07370 [Chloroflexota bacterium]